MPKIKSYPVFDFDELSPEIKEKAIENLRDVNVDDEYWSECTLDDWKERLEARGYKNPDISYSGFCCQGDGASFTCDSVDLPKWLKATCNKGRFAPVMKWIKKNEVYFTARVERDDRRYSHEYTVSAEVDFDFDDYPALVYELRDAITEDVRDLSRQIYKDLERDYDSLISDEAVIDTIEANEWTFDGRGNLDNLGKV